MTSAAAEVAGFVTRALASDLPRPVTMTYLSLPLSLFSNEPGLGLDAARMKSSVTSWYVVGGPGGGGFNLTRKMKLERELLHTVEVLFASLFCFVTGSKGA